MTETSFAIDWWALLWLWVFFLALAALWVWSAMHQQAQLHFSHTNDCHDDRPSFRRRYAFLPKLLLSLALVFFSLAFIDPHLKILDDDEQESDSSPEQEEPQIEEVDIPTEGIALYFVLDRSGSMKQELQFATKSGSYRTLRRIDLLREVTTQFVKGNEAMGLAGRPNDMIGLIAFARVPEILSPLTLDHEAIVHSLRNLDVVGSQNLDGTAIGYAIYKTSHLIAASQHFARALVDEGKPSYEITSQVIVVVTDGLQNPSPLDAEHPRRTISLQEAASVAREHGIRVYIVNVEPAIRRPQFRNYVQELRKAAFVTGGKFFIADDAAKLLEVYSEIDELEKSQLPQGRSGLAEVRTEFLDDETPYYQRVSFFPQLVIAGLSCLGLSVLLSTTYFRRLP